MRSARTFVFTVIFAFVFAAGGVMAAPGVCDSAAIDVEANGVSTAYPTLLDAFAAINSGTHTGAVLIEVCGDTFENDAAILNASGTGAAAYASVHISPAGGAARTIESDLGGKALIELNGADNVTIDGAGTAGSSLTIANLSPGSTSNTSTIRFINDASNNVVTNSNILGSGTVSITTNGGVIFFSLSSGPTGTGNNNNTISFCNIGPSASGTPSKGIYANGSQTLGNRNAGNTIIGNNIFDYFLATGSAGIYINSGNTAWTISNNRLFQTVQRAFTSPHEGIRIGTSVVPGENFQITGNIIGYSSASGTGTYSLSGNGAFRGIHISNSNVAGSPSTIDGNTVTAVNYSSTSSGTGQSSLFIGIYVGQSAGPVNVGSEVGNTIGSLDGSSTITLSTTSGSTFEGHGIFSVANSTSLVSKVLFNRIGSIFGSTTTTGSFSFWGTRLQAHAASTTEIANNSIGPISSNAVGISSRVVGIGLDSAGATPVSTVHANTIRNLSVTAGNAGTGISASVVGIYFAASVSSGHSISRNTISDLSNSNATAATWVSGINYTGPNAGSNVLDGNRIYGLAVSSSNSTATVNGINIVGGTTTFQNNAIALGSEVSTGNTINGINETTNGTDNFYHNSIYISGSATGTGNSFAIQSSITSNARNFLNNILFNSRASTGGKNYALRVGGAAPNPAGLTSNNNILYSPGPSNFVGLFNLVDRVTIGDWQSATGQDLSSLSTDPLFKSPAAATPDLHITNTSPAVSQGATIAGMIADYDTDPRPASAPDIGADEIVQASGGIIAPGAFYNLSLADGDTLGGDVSVNGTLNIQGVSNTGANTLALGCDAVVSGPAAGESNPNYIVGNVSKMFCGTGTFVFPVGTVPAADLSGYSPVMVNVTGGTFPSGLTVGVTDAGLAGLEQAVSVSRFWTVAETGDVTADLAFNYRQEDAGGDESVYGVFRRAGGVTSEVVPNSVDAAGNTASVTAVSGFSDWGVGVGLITAANASLAGRVTTAAGRGVPFARLTVTGGNLPEPITVTANAFGYYKFAALPAGQTYVVSVSSKRSTFAEPSRIVSLDADVSDADFVAEP